MKRSCIFLLLLCSLLLLAACGNEGYSITEPYEYPAYPGTEEWQALVDEGLSTPDLRELLRVPEEILQEMTTDALIQTVLDFPYVFEPLAYDDRRSGFDAHFENNSGLSELYAREDCLEKCELYLVELEKRHEEEKLRDKGSEERQELYLQIKYMELMLEDMRDYFAEPVSEQPPEAAEATELTMVQPFRNSSENEFEPVPLPQSLQGKIEPRSYQLAGNEGSNSRDGISVAAADVAFPAEEVLLRFHNENEHPAMSGLAYRLYAWLDEAWVQQPFSPGYDSFRQLGISIEPGESAYMLCLLKGEAFTPDSLELQEGELPPGRYLLEVQVSGDMEQGKESRSAYYADFSIIEE